MMKFQKNAYCISLQLPHMMHFYLICAYNIDATARQQCGHFRCDHVLAFLYVYVSFILISRQVCVMRLLAARIN